MYTATDATATTKTITTTEAKDIKGNIFKKVF